MTTLPFSTLRDLLRYAVSRFTQAKLAYGQGSTCAYDEAVYLILHTLHLPLDTLEPFLDAQLLHSEIEAVLKIIERRIKERLPAAYLTGEAWLHGYRFYVDENVIVPRSHIGEPLLNHFEPWLDDPDAVENVLDLCTGSACLAILAADKFEQAQVDAVELSEKAIAVAKRNIAEYDLNQRINLYAGSLYDPLPATRQYDLIISNPPYVNDASMQALPPEFRHEPELAFAGGKDGMELVRPIIEGARTRLKPNGVLIVEIGHERAYLDAAFPDLNFTWLSTSGSENSVFLLHQADLLD